MVDPQYATSQEHHLLDEKVELYYRLASERHERIEGSIKDLDVSIQKEFGDLRKSFKDGLIDIELRAADKAKIVKDALDKAESGLLLKLAEMNQFRAQLDTERVLYVTRDQLDLNLKNVTALIRPLEDRQVWITSRDATILGAITVIIAVATLFIKFWH